MTCADTVDRFLSCAQAKPRHLAIACNGANTTYEELEWRARAFAYRLSCLPEPRVMIALPQVADAYAAMMGTALAGGYYTPLNLTSPLEKQRRIVASLDPDVIIGSRAFASVLGFQKQVIDPSVINKSEIFHGAGRRHHVAYIMFTSGSTGAPKGVVISRSALNHYLMWMADTFEITPEDRFSQHPNLAFDLSVTDVFGALCHGATLCPLASNQDRLMPARAIAREKITVWNSVPSVINLIMQARQMTAENLASVRMFHFCGEQLLPEHLRAIFTARPDVLVRNAYGPTEATVAVTHQSLTVSDYFESCAASVAIGEPTRGNGLFLAGGKDPAEGQIVITGHQLADGYWMDEAETAKRFRPIAVDGILLRGYFTGDWAERRNGRLYVRERMDRQVKIRGARVELDEVAAAIRDCGWPIACVFKRGDGLAAVLEEVPDCAFDEARLRTKLAQKLESHAIPATIRIIERIPRSENDKLDFKSVALWFEKN